MAYHDEEFPKTLSTNPDSPELAKLDNSALFSLPKRWTWTNLSAIAELKGGITKGQKRKSQDLLSSVPYLRVANVQRGYLDLADIKQIEATAVEIKELKLLPSPFAPSGPNCLNFKLPIESRPQAQPL